MEPFKVAPRFLQFTGGIQESRNALHPSEGVEGSRRTVRWHSPSKVAGSPDSRGDSRRAHLLCLGHGDLCAVEPPLRSGVAKGSGARDVDECRGSSPEVDPQGTLVAQRAVRDHPGSQGRSAQRRCGGEVGSPIDLPGGCCHQIAGGQPLQCVGRCPAFHRGQRSKRRGQPQGGVHSPIVAALAVACGPPVDN